MNFPKEVQFTFEKRDIGLPYVLWAKIDGGEKWAAAEWYDKPTENRVREAKRIFLRACHIYHKHIETPRFTLREV